MTENSAPERPTTAAADAEDLAARAAMFAAFYRELHHLAQRALRREGKHLSISATTLLHEAFLNLNNREAFTLQGTGSFLAYAAQVMRGHIVDATRRGLAVKRGRDFAITGLHTELLEQLSADHGLLRIDDAQNALWDLDPELGELVDLKYFGGLSLAEIAALRGVSERTVQREWQRARLLLLSLLDGDGLG